MEEPTSTGTLDNLTETQRLNLETLVGQRLGKDLGRPELTLQGMRDTYRELRGWAHLCTQCIKNLGNWSKDLRGVRVWTPPQPAELIKWGDELSTATHRFLLVKMALWTIDPDSLPFLDGGSLDDCQDITTQFAVVRRPNLLFCEMINTGTLYDEIVQAGPEYYSRAGNWHKSQYQLNATDASYESTIFRQELYADETGNSLSTSNRPLSPEMSEIMKWLWSWERRQRPSLELIESQAEALQQEFESAERENRKPNLTRFADRSIPIWMPYRDLHSRTGAWKQLNAETGDYVITKPEHPVHKKLALVLRAMVSVKLISVRKSSGNWYITPLIGRLEHDLSQVILEDDFNIYGIRARMMAKCYQRGANWYPRYGIIMNGNVPLFVPGPQPDGQDGWAPSQSWVKEIVEYNGNKCQTELFQKGGIPFMKSSQLCPTPGYAYDRTGKFSYLPDWGTITTSSFEHMLHMGTARTCIKKEQHANFRISVILDTISKLSKSLCLSSGIFDSKKWNISPVKVQDIVNLIENSSYSGPDLRIISSLAYMKKHKYVEIWHNGTEWYTRLQHDSRFQRQAYAIMRIPDDAFPEMGIRERHVVIFTDIAGVPITQRNIGYVS